MATKKHFYPSTQRKSVKWNEISTQEPVVLNLENPVRFNDERVNSTYNKWFTRFNDEWVNQVANVGVGNSITQYSEWINSRLPYATCALLANDSIINNAISKYANEILRKGGKIVLNCESQENENDIIKALENRMNELNFFDKIHELIIASLTYGGAFLFIDTNTENLSDELYFSERINKENKITNLQVIEPYLIGAVNVNSSNPLNKDFMKPKEWYVSGAGVINSSRLVPLVFFECPDMIKPLYNYLGISLCQFMKNYVMTADISRQSLCDIFLRFRTIIIKSDLAKINADEAASRVKFINRERNNAGTLLLTSDEEYIESITSLQNLDKLIAQMQENIAVSARMPAVKLLGLTPSGFNATGDFDLKSYYDEIMSYQNALIKPIIEKFLRVFALEMGFDIYPKYEFENLNSENALNQAQINSTESQTISNLIQSGIITQEQGFNYLQGKQIIDKGESFDDSAGDTAFAGEFDFENDENQGKDDDENNDNLSFEDGIEFDKDGNPYFVGEGYNYNLKMSNNAVNDIANGIKPLKFFSRADADYLGDCLGLKKGTIKVKDLKRELAYNGGRESYHHIGNNYKKEDFYSIKSLLERNDKIFGVDISKDVKNKFSKNEHRFNFAQTINMGVNDFTESITDNAYDGELTQEQVNNFKSHLDNVKEYIVNKDKIDKIKNDLDNGLEISQRMQEKERQEKEKQEKEREKQEKERQEKEREKQAIQQERANEINKFVKNINVNEEDIASRVDDMKKQEISKTKLLKNFTQLSQDVDNASNDEDRQKALNEFNKEYLAIKEYRGDTKGFQNTFLRVNNKYNSQKVDEKNGSGEWKESDHPRNPDGSFKTK